MTKRGKSKATAVPEIPLQAAALDIWAQKYCLRDAHGAALDASVEHTWQRIARAVAEVEAPALRAHWYREFLWALRHGAIPAGRIVANAGAGAHKPATSTINCTVSATLEDSMEAILGRLQEAGLTLKAGCGIGYEFSTLRPRGARVSGAGAQTSGPLSFMDIYDKMCFTVSSAGGRRGAQMATFDIAHPDVRAFIDAKREDGRLRQFNLSLLVGDDFMQAVEQDKDWPLLFPVHAKERDTLDLGDPAQVRWRDWPLQQGYCVGEDGRVACRVYGSLPARQLWDQLMAATYAYAEPGFILIDRVNEWNNNWWCEHIRATNPCGEQPLPPHGSCLLGSINLTRFVLDPFGATARFDWEAFRRVVRIFTRLLDNVVEINGLPLPAQREEILGKRRHGMGFLGLGSALALLKLRYGSAEACAFTEEVVREMALTGWQVALELAEEKGPAPLLAEEFEVSARMLRLRPELAADGYQAGDKVPGRVLHARYSRYMQRLAEQAPELVAALAERGARFTHHSSIAPTGTISLSLANNASNGIEPSFAQHYWRNLIRPGRKSKARVEVFSYELLAYRALVNPRAMPGSDDPAERLPDYFVSSEDIGPTEHVDMQAAAQKWIDSSISKTANVPADYPFEAFKDIYRYAWRQGLKGCTTFRFNPAAFQGCWSSRRTWRAPATASSWRTAARWNCRATRRWSTTARCTAPPTCSRR
ncbi:adenosylcobalamin-dependent ribonucleoside-diphosphate reductase [Pseudomonas lalucatii]|nr:adenosylcobalamin-dependent ribonucleoside-diphosphate reductase [Pseudomonas lalucatii]